MKRPLTYLALATLAVALAVTVCYHWVDIPLARAAQDLGIAVHRYWEPVTQAGLSGWYLAGLAVLAVIFRFVVKRPVLFNRCVFMFLTVLWTGLLVLGLKFVLGRARPPALNEGHYGFDPFEWDWARNSMPSGHAATVAAMAACLWVLLPRYWWLWIALALPIAISRCVVATHYISDVIVGAYVAVMMMMINLHVLERWGVRLRTPVDSAG